MIPVECSQRGFDSDFVFFIGEFPRPRWYAGFLSLFRQENRKPATPITLVEPKASAALTCSTLARGVLELRELERLRPLGVGELLPDFHTHRISLVFPLVVHVIGPLERTSKVCLSFRPRVFLKGSDEPASACKSSEIQKWMRDTATLSMSRPLHPFDSIPI